MKRLAVGLLIAGLTAGCAGRQAVLPPEPILILVSLDGFRWDYMDIVETPHLRQLAASGVRAEGLIPVFPSKTFPSHYSLVTGLHPGRHGILSNNMYDPELGEFHLSDRDAVEDGRWWDGEPIWVTAEKQGIKTATMFWPGSEAEIGGVRPSHWRRFDIDLDHRDRVTQVLGWLDLPSDERPHFLTLYLEQPNDTSHDFGPEAPETFAAVREVDARIGDLVAGLEERDLSGQVNLLVVSDHGMAETGPQRVIILDDYVELEDGEVFEQGAMVQIFPGEEREAAIVEALQGAHPNLQVYRRDEIPQRFHLEGNPRVPPVLGVPDVGWEVFTRAHFAEHGETMVLGDHGQDPADPLMHGLFVAAGPAFAESRAIGRIESVELYNLMAAVLEIEPAPNDGNPDALAGILK